MCVGLVASYVLHANGFLILIPLGISGALGVFPLQPLPFPPLPFLPLPFTPLPFPPLLFPHLPAPVGAVVGVASVGAMIGAVVGAFVLFALVGALMGAVVGALVIGHFVLLVLVFVQTVGEELGAEVGD